MRLHRVVATVLVSMLVVAACGDDPEEGTGEEVEGVVVESGQSNGHVDDPTYDADPPSGGDHIDIWLDCGVYDIAVPNGNAVHSLEHGAVWFTYDPEADVDVDALVALAAERSDRVIVSPYPGLAAPVVAVAWERRLEVDSADDPRLGEFLDTYVNGAAAPEPAVTCAGGVGLAD
ncbi:DUF3105 domain-containing protein [Actinospongicola halichondriae]|uniref:DUF3105 domain-containing protein n=1 Tax=Actinospongicola halichondriae TaxID=3236844 RepID=UPI003D5A0F9F